MRIRKSTLKKIIAEATRSLNEGTHPYDEGIKQAMNIGYYSSGDAIDEIEGDLRRVKLTRVDDTTITVSYGSNSRTLTFEDDTPEEAARKGGDPDDPETGEDKADAYGS